MTTMAAGGPFSTEARVTRPVPATMVSTVNPMTADWTSIKIANASGATATAYASPDRPRPNGCQVTPFQRAR